MTRLFVVAVLAACSSRAPAPTTPDEPHGSADVQPTGSGTGSAGSGSAAPTAEPKVTEAQCLAMFDHMVALDVSDRPPDQHISREEQAEVAAKMRTQLPTCLTMRPSLIACVMAAKTGAAMEACE